MINSEDINLFPIYFVNKA